MTQSPGAPKPPKLTPGEPLWGSPTISSGDSPPALEPSRKRQRAKPAPPPPAVAGAPAAATAGAPPRAAPRGPVQFGPTAPASATVYGGGTGQRAGRKPIGLLAGVGAIGFVLGLIVGAAAVYFLI